MYLAFADIIVALALGTFWTLAFEAPMNIIEIVIFGSGKRRTIIWTHFLYAVFVGASSKSQKGKNEVNGNANISKIIDTESGLAKEDVLANKLKMLQPK